MRILYIADPNSAHDRKWMSFFSKDHQCAVVARTEHLKLMTPYSRREFEIENNLQILLGIDDFSLRRLVSTLLSARKLVQTIHRFQPDIVHVLYAEPNVLWVFVKMLSLTPTKWMVTTRGSDILRAIPSFFRRSDFQGRLVAKLYRLAFSQLSCVTCTSTKQANEVWKLLGFTGPVTVIWSGVDLQAIRQPRPELIPVELVSRRYILFPRMMHPIYNHELGLEIVRKLSLWSPELSYVFVDCDKGDSDYVARIVRVAKDMDNIVFLPRLENKVMWEVFRGALLSVMTLKSDGSPVSAMESLACGTPVVAPPLDYDPMLAECFDVAPSWSPADFFETICSALKRKRETQENNDFERMCNRDVQMKVLEKLYLDLVK